MVDEEKRHEHLTTPEEGGSSEVGRPVAPGDTSWEGESEDTEPSGDLLVISKNPDPDGQDQGMPASGTAIDSHDAAPHDLSHAGHHGNGHGHDEHFAHTLPMSLLLGVLVALILLTILTVGVTAIDLGSQGNFIVAMIIATVKAGLVMGYFMHMVWDSKFNVVAFTSSFLFVLLFLATSLADRQEYQPSIDLWERDQKIEALAE